MTSILNRDKVQFHVVDDPKASPEPCPPAPRAVGPSKAEILQAIQDHARRMVTNVRSEVALQYLEASLRGEGPAALEKIRRTASTDQQADVDQAVEIVNILNRMRSRKNRPTQT